MTGDSGMRRLLDRWLRSAAYDIVCRRDGKNGWKAHRSAFLRSTRQSRADVQASVDEGLRRIVEHAYNTSPYYRSAWDAIGCRPTRHFSSTDLPSLPFLTKDVVREQKLSLVSGDYPVAGLVLSLTGGTTGAQTAFYLDPQCATTRFGRQWGALQLSGYRPGMRRGLVWGVHADLLEDSLMFNIKRAFRDYACADDVLCCSVLDESIMLAYCTSLHRFRPAVLYGYPSALARLALFIRDRGLEPVRVKTIITTAERLSQARRQLLEEEFGGRVWNLYCTREYGCIAFECSEHDGLHVDTGSVVVEIVRDGQRSEPNESGEIVVTDLLNRGMPFIRSRTGDFGVLSDEPCRCGKPQPLLKRLDGRSTEVVYRPDGGVVAGLILADLFPNIDSIKLTQFVQRDVNAIDLLLVTTSDYTDEVQTEVIRQVRTMMGDEIKINVLRVSDIPRNPRSGKHEEIICTVQPARHDP